MESIKTIYIYKSRKAGEVIKDAFTYVSSDARLLIKLAAVFSFALFIISHLVSYSIINQPPRIEAIFYYRNEATRNSLLFLGLAYLAFILAYCLLTLAVNKLMIKRNDGINDEQTDVFADIKNDVVPDMRTYAMNFIIIYVLYYITTFILNYFSKPGILMETSYYDEDAISYGVELIILYIPTIVIGPLILYFGFGSLFVSLRDNIGSTEALQKIIKFSHGKYKKIWLGSALIVLVAVVAEFILQFSFQYLLGFILGFLEYRPSVFIYIHIMQKLLTLGIFVFMQVAGNYVLGSVEEDVHGHYIAKKIEGI